MMPAPLALLALTANRSSVLEFTNGPQGATLDPSWMLREYYRACCSDLGGVSHAAGGLIDDAGMTISFEIAPSLLFDARIRRAEVNAYVISLSLGLFLACDDLAGVLLPYYEQELGPLNKSKSMEIRSIDPEWGSRFINYEKILSGEADSFAPFRGAFSAPGFSHLRTIIANGLLVWCVAHEVGHLLLGHVDHVVGHSNDLAYSEFEDAYLFAGLGIDHQGPNIYFAREFEADYYATWITSFLFLQASNVPYLSSLHPTGNVEPEYSLGLLTNIVSYAPMIFQKAALGRKVGDPQSKHPHPLARAFNSWTALEFVQPGLLESIDYKPGQERLFLNFTAEQCVEVWVRSISHIYFVSRFLGFEFSRGGDEIDSRGNIVDGWHTGIENELTRFDACSIILSIWHSKFFLNYFQTDEPLFKYVDQWKENWKLLGGQLAEVFARVAPAIPRPSIAAMAVDFVHHTERMVFIEASKEIRRPEKVGKIIGDSAIIAGIVARVELW